MPGIRALIVDDEALARRGIAARLERAGGIEVVGQSGSGREAIRAIRDLRPELVFLDVQMPGMGGFEVIETIGPAAMPAVIFVTAHDEHALRAFDAEALDYVLKPIDDERFARTLERARRRLASRPAAADSRLLVRERGRVAFVDPADVDWIEARGDYMRLHVGREVHLVRETMAGLVSRLDPARFARIHRSTIVNRGRIREIVRRGDRDCFVRLAGGETLRVGRGYRGALKY